MGTVLAAAPPRRVTRRAGRWSYGEHPGLNPGWLLRGTPLVLDYDDLNRQGCLLGAYCLFRDGLEIATIDHYLDDSMSWVERQPAAELLAVTPRTTRSAAAERQALNRLLAGGFAGTVLEAATAVEGILARPGA